MAEEQQKAPLVSVPPFCYRHLHKLVHDARYKDTDPWRVLVMVGNLVMFQAAASTPTVWKKCGGDVTKIGELGCLACRLPAKFEQVCKTASKGTLQDIKLLGESWVEGAGGFKLNEENDNDPDTSKRVDQRD